jgi:hypothetical protein
MAGDQAAKHREAVDRHELAARNHQRAAAFWEDRGDRERAALQREFGDYERVGAEIERRWAELSEKDAHRDAAPAGAVVVRHTLRAAENTSVLLAQLADTLARSAQLAEEHARRQEHGGNSGDAGKERDAAKRARELAEHARSQARRWRELVGADPEG